LLGQAAEEELELLVTIGVPPSVVVVVTPLTVEVVVPVVSADDIWLPTVGKNWLAQAEPAWPPDMSLRARPSRP
jgi:hypothetical protein